MWVLIIGVFNFLVEMLASKARKALKSPIPTPVSLMVKNRDEMVNDDRIEDGKGKLI
jgi:hypothetical protein